MAANPYKICRTCLQQIIDSSEMFYLDSNEPEIEQISIAHKLRDCVPELVNNSFLPCRIP